MIPRLLILFILIPLVELFLLVAVASRIQLPATILLVVVSSSVRAPRSLHPGCQALLVGSVANLESTTVL